MLEFSEMDRRNFLRTLIGGVAAGAAVRTFPFRVYSFPSRLTIPTEIEDFRYALHDAMRIFRSEMDREMMMNGVNLAASRANWEGTPHFVITKVDQIRKEITVSNVKSLLPPLPALRAVRA